MSDTLHNDILVVLVYWVPILIKRPAQLLVGHSVIMKHR